MAAFQQQGVLPPFALPVHAYQVQGWIQPWQRFRNLELRRRLERYDRCASDSTLSARQWPHPPTKPSSKHANLFAMEHYVSVLERDLGVDTAGLAMAEIFPYEHLRCYQQYCQQQRDGKDTSGIVKRLWAMGHLAELLLGLDRAPFRLA